MNYEVNLHHAHGNEKIGEGLAEIGEKTLIMIGAKPGSLTIALVDDSTIQDLNLRYRGIDAPTDVLAFGDGQNDLETGASYFGDVIISISTARAQAESAGHSLDAELILLTVHGILHLMGHDHVEEQEAALMGSMQSEIFHQIGLTIVHPDPAL